MLKEEKADKRKAEVKERQMAALKQKEASALAAMRKKEEKVLLCFDGVFYCFWGALLRSILGSDAGFGTSQALFGDLFCALLG